MSVTSHGPELTLRPIAAVPGSSAEDEWVAVARDVAAQLAVDAVQRDRAGDPPLAEAALIREAGLLPLLAPEVAGGHARPYRIALAVADRILGLVNYEVSADEVLGSLDADGLNLSHVITPGSYVDFADHVVPELQRRGVCRTAYERGTLREKLFGRGPRLPGTHRAAAFRRAPVAG